ncbi:MAG: hypothetical protein WAU42_14715 [Solirubrobacteraceae bacterium]
MDSSQALSVVWCDRARYVVQGTPIEVGSHIGDALTADGVLIGLKQINGDDVYLAINKISSIEPITLDEARSLVHTRTRRAA